MHLVNLGDVELCGDGFCHNPADDHEGDLACQIAPENPDSPACASERACRYVGNPGVDTAGSGGAGSIDNSREDEALIRKRAGYDAQCEGEGDEAGVAGKQVDFADRRGPQWAICRILGAREGVSKEDFIAFSEFLAPGTTVLATEKETCPVLVVEHCPPGPVVLYVSRKAFMCLREAIE